MSDAHNPPAFPQGDFSFMGGDGREGMTLRDLYAGQFFAAKVSAAPEGYLHPAEWPVSARDAFEQADAMLAARKASAQ